ncbi:MULTISPECIES: trp operon leader peptide [unclassified Streptomyces]
MFAYSTCNQIQNWWWTAFPAAR